MGASTSTPAEQPSGQPPIYPTECPMHQEKSSECPMNKKDDQVDPANMVCNIY